MYFKLPSLCVGVYKILMYVKQANFNISFCNNSILKIQLNDFDSCRVYSHMFEKDMSLIIFSGGKCLTVV